jgi:phosphate-selective porin OprO and OprP
MRNRMAVLGLALLGALVLLAGSAVSVAAQDQPFSMRIGARAQVRATFEDPAEGKEQASVGIRRGRLTVSGAAYEHFDYAIQVELAGGNARLLDANIRTTISPLATVWFGQGKAFFGRQQLNSSGNLHFVDRSIVDGRFSAGRQQGVAVIGSPAGDLLEYNVGVYNGDGINQSSNGNNRFMSVARLVFTPWGSYSPSESAHDYPASPRLAVGVSGLRNTLAGTAGDTELTRMNTEAAFKLHGINMTGEFYREWAEPAAGESFTTNGWYTQAGYLFPGGKHEIAGRRAKIQAPSTSAGPGGRVETGVAYSRYFRGHGAKLQFDLRNLRNRATADSDHEVRVQFQLAV